MTPERKAFRHEMYVLLGRLARSIGHDLRNPLGLITHAVYLLKLQIEQGDPEALETAEIILNATSDTECILDGLRDYTCVTSAEPAPYHIQDILRSALMQLHIPDNISHKVIAEDAIPMMMVDGDQLLVAFRILMEYCMHVMPDGGTFSILLALNDGLILTFNHSGDALSEAQGTALFDPFASETPYEDGLALPLAQILIELQGGSISIIDGVRFLIHLPVIEAEYPTKV